MVEKICEILLKWKNNFSAKGRMMYYREKYKHAILYKKRKKLNDKGVQQTPPNSFFKRRTYKQVQHTNDRNKRTRKTTHTVLK